MKAFRVKYRPIVFDDVVGIDRYKTVLKNITENNLSRPIMFVGKNGTGKSTLAEILAKRMVCDNPKGLNPCNSCDSCNTTNLTATGFAAVSYSGDELNERRIDRIMWEFQFVPIYNFHTLIVDDLDHAYISSQKRLIRLINTHETALIITTVTHPKEIDVPLYQRSLKIGLNNYSVDDLYKLAIRIIKSEKMKYEDDESIYALISFAKQNPRNILNILEIIKMMSTTVSKMILKEPEVNINLGEQVGA